MLNDNVMKQKMQEYTTIIDYVVSINMISHVDKNLKISNHETIKVESAC